ncbi:MULTISPECIES: hypothetical protein [Actinomadura]|uniref:Ferredoxin n=1 Tax=Actinomadura geliboluensis TaxID=882440 RepID=A0A5S4H7G4_9ACTN|nr:hypothetical protein [Actinomadura geliboluensis]TMR41183.1 hypothetical protein ETD96_06825 [Actinomadura geliboluensis]
MQPVDCRACGTRVLVSKNSPPHTSVQWTTDAGATCGEFAPRVAAGEPAARIPHCAALRSSIEHAVAEGLVRIGPEE